MWIRRTFKTVSPDDTRGVFKKLKRSKGRTLNGGSPISGVSDNTMKWLGRILVSSCVLVPIFLATVWLTGISGFGIAVMMLIPLVHLFLIVGEMVTHRDIPGRFRAMAIVWGSLIVAAIMSAFV